MKKLFFLISILGTPFALHAQTEGVSQERTEPEKEISEKATPPEMKKAKKTEDEKRPMRKGRHFRDMDEKERMNLMFFRHLIMEKYDVNKNDRLDDEEKEVMRKDAERFGKQRRDMILKRFDKDKDGKLSDEEKTEMRRILKEEMEKRLKERGGKEERGEMMPPPPPRKLVAPKDVRKGAGDSVGKRGVTSGSESPRKDHPGSQGKGPGNENERRGFLPVEVIMVHGHHLMMERYDKDKDGKLGDEEKKEMLAGRDTFVKELKERHQKFMEKRAGERAKREEKKKGGREPEPQASE